MISASIDIDGPDDCRVRKFLENCLLTTPLGAQPSGSFRQEKFLKWKGELELLAITQKSLRSWIRIGDYLSLSFKLSKMFSHLRVLSRIDMRNVNKSLDTGLARNSSKTSGSMNVDVVKVEVPRLKLTPDQVEGDVGVSQRFPDRLFVFEVKGWEQNLTQIAANSKPQNVVMFTPIRNDQLKARCYI